MCWAREKRSGEQKIRKDNELTHCAVLYNYKEVEKLTGLRRIFILLGHSLGLHHDVLFGGKTLG